VDYVQRVVVFVPGRMKTRTFFRWRPTPIPRNESIRDDSEWHALEIRDQKTWKLLYSERLRTFTPEMRATLERILSTKP